jgi:hypothetical protein
MAAMRLHLPLSSTLRKSTVCSNGYDTLIHGRLSTIEIQQKLHRHPSSVRRRVHACGSALSSCCWRTPASAVGSGSGSGHCPFSTTGSDMHVGGLRSGIPAAHWRGVPITPGSGGAHGSFESGSMAVLPLTPAVTRTVGSGLLRCPNRSTDGQWPLRTGGFEWDRLAPHQPHMPKFSRSGCGFRTVKGAA